METELYPRYDTRASFYGKAKVINENGKLTLISYNTEVAYIKNNRAYVLGSWSITTTRHIKEFLKQNGFKAENTNQMLNDYPLYTKVELIANNL